MFMNVFIYHMEYVIQAVNDGFAVYENSDSRIPSQSYSARGLLEATKLAEQLRKNNA